MKHLLYLLAICLLVLSFPAAVFAQTNFRSGQDINLSADEVVNKDYFAAGNNVSLDGTVNGDAYLAGGNITLNGVVNGDVLIAGGNLNINGTVTGNVRAIGGNINISGKVGRNASVAGGSINLLKNADVSGSITIAGGQATIGSTVNGNINAAVGQLTLSSGASVGGSIVYWSENKLNLNPEASVSGTITQNIPPKKIHPQFENAGRAGAGFLAALRVIGFLTSLVIGLLVIKLLPGFSTKISANIREKWLTDLGMGFLALAVSPILVILLLITVVGIPIAVLWLFFMLFGYWLAKIFVALTIGLALMKYFKQTWSIYLTYLLGMIVYYLIVIIPVIGGIFGFVAAVTGLGSIILTKRQYYLDLRGKKLI